MAEEFPKRLGNVSRLAQINLTHMLRLTNECLFQLETYVALSTNAYEGRQKIRRVILATMCELHDTWEGVSEHFTEARMAKSVCNWESVKCVRDQTQILMDSLQQCKQRFQQVSAEIGPSHLKAGLLLLKQHLEGPVNIMPIPDVTS
jgi:hypothetical protein